MDYVNLGATGLKVSRICLGTMTYGSSKWREWVLDEEASRPLIKQALEAGINFFDTADMYSSGASEEVLGRALKNFGPGRDKIVIATKVFYPMGGDPNQRGLSRKHIMHAIDDSLQRLGTDYVDLYQIHRFDPKTPIEETLGALHDVVRAGKALYLGASSMAAWQFAKMLYTSDSNGWTRFATMQNHYNLIYREEEREMIPLCLEEGIGVLPWSPLARGLLAGKRRPETIRARTDSYMKQLYGEEIGAADARAIQRLEAVAAEHGVVPAQVALAWLAQKPGVVAPIVGVSKPGHLDDALAALKIRLTAEAITSLEEVLRPALRGGDVTIKWSANPGAVPAVRGSDLQSQKSLQVAFFLGCTARELHHQSAINRLGASRSRPARMTDYEIMKPLIALLSSFLFCSCADMYVTKTDVAGSSTRTTATSDAKDYDSKNGVRMVTNCGVGASEPRAIYIRPFCIDTAIFKGDEAASDGEMPIRKALTPIEFAGDLKESLEELAPARILKDDETPRTGWLVEGEFTMVDGGSPLGRFFLGTFGVGRSFLALHVKVTDVDKGITVYEFDMAGGSRGQGHHGTIRASGLGRATPFDLVNAAERIYLVLEPNAFRYGKRSNVALH